MVGPVANCVFFPTPKCITVAQENRKGTYADVPFEKDGDLAPMSGRFLIG